MESYYSLLPDPASIRLPLPSAPPPSTPQPPAPSSPPVPAVLVVDGTDDIGRSLIHTLRSSSPSLPVTAFARALWTDEQRSKLAELLGPGVTVHSLSPMFAYKQKRALVRSAGRVVLWAPIRCGAMTAPQLAKEMLDWIDACHAEKAEHVVYISTASPELFATLPSSCAECTHIEAELRLRADRGIQHWTILRPVQLMSMELPRALLTGKHVHWRVGTVDSRRVFVRLDPSRKQQLIAPADVGRIAAQLLLHEQAEQWYGKVLEVAGPSHLSALEEVELRSAVLGGEQVELDTRVWDQYNNKNWRGQHGWRMWILPQRRYVSQDVAKYLLPGGLQDYRMWFSTELKRLAAKELEDVYFRSH